MITEQRETFPPDEIILKATGFIVPVTMMWLFRRSDIIASPVFGLLVIFNLGSVAASYLHYINIPGAEWLYIGCSFGMAASYTVRFISKKTKRQGDIYKLILVLLYCLSMSRQIKLISVTTIISYLLVAFSAFVLAYFVFGRGREELEDSTKTEEVHTVPEG